MNINDLITLIKEDKNARENREGFTPLFLLAQEIRQDMESEQSQEISRLITKIDLYKLSKDNLNTLNAFIYHSGINTDDILTSFRKYLDDSNNKTEDVIKKGLILRFIIDRDRTKSSYGEIDSETSLKKSAPWVWIDCMSYYNWEATESFILDMIKSGEDVFRNLFIRIPTLKRKVGDEKKLRKSLLVWYCSMKGQKEKLIFWAEKFGFSLHKM